MADIGDWAQALEAMHKKLAMDARPKTVVGAISATHCAECEEPIPEGRRKAMPGCTLCVKCQEELER